MTRIVNVVVTCTQRKKLEAVGRMRLGTVKRTRIRPRAEAWRKSLQQNGVPTMSARDLYAGDSWSVVLGLAAAARSRGISPRVWVCSAGYGLIPLDAELAGYAATFSPGHEDSVSSHVDSSVRIRECQEWWGAMTTWSGPKPGSPRSIAALAAQAPRTPMMFAGSDAYLKALQADLVEAAATLRQRLTVISAGASSLDGLSDHQLPCDARFQGKLGGARQSINVRILRSLLEQAPGGDFDYPSALEIINKMSEDLDPLQKFNREPMTDEQVREFVRKALATNPKAKHSPLLRELRETGFRCEQTRFKLLFQEEANRHGG